MHASAVPVRPRPPPHATSTRSFVVLSHASLIRRAALGSDRGTLKSFHLIQSDGQGVGLGRLPSR